MNEIPPIKPMNELLFILPHIDKKVNRFYKSQILSRDQAFFLAMIFDITVMLFIGCTEICLVIITA